ncbi:MAG TPA: hypothetical protein VHE35_23110 [Kofleriaceae bacterium]|nr:hypothetical protein [Kofleriaceae bacterium]
MSPPRPHPLLRRALAAVAAALLASCAHHGPPPTTTTAAAHASEPVDPAAVDAAIQALVARHGEDARPRIERGVKQVAALWRKEDGDLSAFCLDQFVAGPQELDALFDRLEQQFEQLDGHLLELERTLKWNTDVDTGPMLPVDPLLAAFDPSAGIVEGLFDSKVAFVALLNFPLIPLAEQQAAAATYTRRQWAELALTRRFDRRVPADIAAAAAAAESDADGYVAGYNLWMHHVLDDSGHRRFPSGKRLISHWNLRDELKANYADADGLAKQRTIVQVMERIVTQTIPRAVIDNPRLDWDPFANTVTASPPEEIEADAPADRPTTPSTASEPDTRFEHVLARFRAERRADAYAPTAPTYLDRAFADARLPEERVRGLIVELLESPLAADAAREIKARLGRDLEPEDLWYEFGGGTLPERELDAETRRRYPDADAFAADLPRIFHDLGFTDAQARTLAASIAVDPSRGAGHAMQAERRGDKPHLRTRIEAGGMDYKGYNIAIHELGHNVEQYFSLYEVDHTLLKGVPNTAFTEALAFLFQARDLQLLGRASAGPEAERLRVLDAFWNAREIAGSALVELDVWHWLYAHPQATAADLRQATVSIARAAWDRYYAPYLGGAGQTSLLGIYSHTISIPLYLFNYVLGHCIAFQLEEHVAGKDAATFASEYARVARQGSILPDAWMIGATGAPVSPKSLLDATARALHK